MSGKLARLHDDENFDWSEMQILCFSGALRSPRQINLTWYDRYDYPNKRMYVSNICLRGNDRAEEHLPAFITTEDGYRYSLSDLNLLPLLQERQLDFLTYLQNDGSSFELVIEDHDGYLQVLSSVTVAIKNSN